MIFGFIKAARDVTTPGSVGLICLKDGKQTEISTRQARSKGFVAPVNDPEVPITPNKMKNKGFHPNNPNIPKDAR